MKKRTAMFLAAAMAAMCATAEPVVTDVVAKQRYPWNGLVDITCKVTGISGTDQWKFELAAVMPDTGEARKVSQFWVVKNGVNSTDKKVQANGTYKLLWDASAELGQVTYDNMVVRATVIDHDMVQLWEGGPYWADRNIGAAKPEDYGLYFWWGDTTGHRQTGFSFRPANCPTDDKSTAMLMSEGWITADGVLAPSHDAANVQWGGGWRMPTHKELYDLCYNKCEWTWTTMNGVKGYIVCGRGIYSSESIFLPATGFVDNYESSSPSSPLYHVGSGGFYWSSSAEANNPTAYNLTFFSYIHLTGSTYRYCGIPIRPVQGAVDSSTSLSAGESAVFRLDTMDGPRIAWAVETIAYSTAWNGGGTVSVAVDGVAIKEANAPASGDVVWNAAQTGPGTHTLTHTCGGETLTAVFEVAEANYTIRYEANNGSGESVSETVAEGEDCTDVSAEDFEFTWEGHYFAGWAFAPGGDMVGSEEVAAEAQRNGGTVSLYARWLTLEPFSTDWGSGTITLLFGGAKGGTYLSVECRHGDDPNAAWTSITGDIKWSMVNESVVSIDDPLYWSRYNGIPPIEYRVVETETGFEAKCITRTKYAISVGVGLYERVLSDDGRMIPWVGEEGDREFMADYAELFAKLAKKSGAQEANIHTFTNETANRGNINHAFESVSTTIRSGDICLLYFGTHGGADGTASTLALYGNKEYYTEADLANHIDLFAPDWGVATVCIVHACESGGFANNENDQYCVGGGWCVNEQLVSRNAAWITATDKPDVSAYGESFSKFLLGYGWNGGWAGSDGQTLSFGDLADYLGKTYDVLFSGVRVGDNPDVIQTGVTNKTLLSRVVAGICPRHEAKTKPVAFSVTPSTDDPDKVVLKTSRLSADTLQVFSRFVNGGEWSSSSRGISDSGDSVHLLGMDSTVEGEVPGTRHSSVDDKMEFIVKAYNGAGVTAAYNNPVQGWRVAMTAQTEDGRTWNYGKVEGGVSIVSAAESSASGYGDALKGDVAIPSTLNGMSVVSISAHAFEGCEEITSVTIPDSVTSIGERAFYGCPDLQQIVIPRGVTSIANFAFGNCISLSEVMFEGDTNSIDMDIDVAFAGTPWLESQGRPVSTDGFTIFEGILLDVDPQGRTEIIIPNTVVKIGRSAFNWTKCANVKSVVIPNSVLIIDREAFAGCNALERIFIPDSVVSIEERAFQGSGLREAVIGKGVLNILTRAFAHCESLERVIFRGRVEYIGDYAFYGCVKLDGLDLPDSLSHIGAQAFGSCSSISSEVIAKPLIREAEGASRPAC